MKKILKSRDIKKVESENYKKNIVWDKSETKLTKDFFFRDFRAAADFLRTLAGQFEEMKNEDILNNFREIRFMLETRSENKESADNSKNKKEMAKICF